MKQTTITAATFTPTELFALVERLPETFHRNGRSRFLAMDDQNTYVIVPLDSGYWYPNGFSIGIVSRHRLSYEEHSFMLDVESEGIDLVEALNDFGAQVRRFDDDYRCIVELAPLKCAFRDARHTVDIVTGENVPVELGREALQYVLSRAKFRGRLTVMLSNPIWISTSTHDHKLPEHLPAGLASLKPKLRMDFRGGELWRVTDVRFILDMPERNIVEEMKALNTLAALGVSDDDIKELDDFADTIALR